MSGRELGLIALDCFLLTGFKKQAKPLNFLLDWFDASVNTLGKAILLDFIVALGRFCFFFCVE